MSDKPRSPPDNVNRHFTQACREWNVSHSFAKRARSHGLIRVIYFGDRPMVPPDEFERIQREGLPDIPPGYKRQTTGPVKGGRPRKVAKTAKPSRRRKRDEAERRVAP